ASWFPTCTPNNSYSCTFSGGACSADDCGKSVSKVALCEKTETKANCDTVKTFVTPTTLCGSSCVSETKDCPQCETTWKEKEP
ncbi:MAG TPA: hypothetical protein VK469_21205, partial [Candidatus Kapabacteria bacterium]|nr:hypothetical protein [Candidatus Kapabacteria bacterium]